MRRRLIISVALVHALMMTLVVLDTVRRQHAALLEEQTSQAWALARSIAASSAGWVISKDLYGLQEIINAQSRYSQLKFAMITDTQGHILAHSERRLIGQFVDDVASRSAESILSREEELADVVTPVEAKGRRVGWVRVGVAQVDANRRHEEVLLGGLSYALAATIIGSIIAWVLGTQLTHGLRALLRATDAVKDGDLSVRISLDGQSKEVANLGLAFNNMLDSIATSQQRLRESEERFMLAMKASQDGMWDWNLENNDVHFSPRWKEIVGYQDHELPNKISTWKRLVDAKGRMAALELVEQCRKGERNDFNLSFRMLHKDGHWIDILTQAILVRDDQGHANRLVGTHTDITERLKTEGALRHAVKMQAVGELTGGIAHDFNNILGIVMGNLELLEMKLSNQPEMLHRIDLALQGVQRGAAITRKLLNFSRGEAEPTEAINPNATIGKLKELFARSLTPKIEIKTHLQPDLWMVDVNEGELEDVLLNIVLNARDAMPDGGELILDTSNATLDEHFVRGHFSARLGDHVLLIITDTGAGIPEEVRERIFEPFFSTKEKGRGTGLGLSMVYAFVRRHGGTLDVYSEEGVGSTFRIYLPRLKVSQENGEHFAPDAVVELVSGNETILVVDDEIMMAEMAQAALEELGYNVLTANSYKSGKKMLDLHPGIDLLFTDVIMPGGGNGFELAELAKSRRPNLKVLLTSGYSYNQVPVSTINPQALERWRARLLGKPYTRSQLAQAIRRELDEVEAQVTA